ncbi:MAG: hypothetical protein RML94_02540 [Bacteroidia bacterium]|nr:hypothetical protein [Bacteroidia bacterium]
MRHAEGVRQHGAKPLAYVFTLAQGWGAAPLARSTPTRAQRGTRPKNTKKYIPTSLPNTTRLSFTAA